ncbi:hypothetical protein Sa4125_24910 [Aureimonas sp. SA4125]|uniref:LysM peptidoglycan-binding domain-containing protein n=1 Tax=Aureimonas sp. SA4125 TaxID=2826993 RepID=UPI001CC6C27C|nr:LysM domain-containing protein [Aureimonas sp. SA4125]BDA84949.1 hypothetical protein Sa4125_24910 [Aureimonas sp. SA4125]
MRSYTVSGEESLAEIAKRELGHESYWLRLYAWNAAAVPKNIASKDRVAAGVVLMLPNTPFA